LAEQGNEKIHWKIEAAHDHEVRAASATVARAEKQIGNFASKPPSGFFFAL
jgi:hypothetical protein